MPSSAPLPYLTLLVISANLELSCLLGFGDLPGTSANPMIALGSMGSLLATKRGWGGHRPGCKYPWRPWLPSHVLTLAGCQ